MSEFSELLKTKGMDGSRASLARLLDVSRASLYYQPKRPALDEAFKEKVLEVLVENPAYGHRRIAIALGANKKKVARVMSKFHIKPTVRRMKRGYGKRKKSDPELWNLIADLRPTGPNCIWAGDFTEIEIGTKRIVFLATVIDVYTREIVGWQIGSRHTTELVLDAMKSAERSRSRTPDFFHSDQGSEYTSQESLAWMKEHDIQASFSPPGKPWKNGFQESFFNTLKLEIGNTHRFKTVPDLYEAIAKLIHYYNNKRIHGMLKMPPRTYFLKAEERSQRLDAIMSDEANFPK